MEIDWNGEKAKVVIKRITFGEKNDIEEDAMTVRFAGREPLITVSQKKLKELYILKALKEAPFPITIDGIRALDPEVGDFIYNEIAEMNSYSGIKKSD